MLKNADTPEQIEWHAELGGETNSRIEPLSPDLNGQIVQKHGDQRAVTDLDENPAALLVIKPSVVSDLSTHNCVSGTRVHVELHREPALLHPETSGDHGRPSALDELVSENDCSGGSHSDSE